jgi:hypothetical protein
MLTLLPIFFALGFCFGFYLPSWRQRETRQGNVERDYSRRLVLFVLVAYAAVLLTIVAVQALSRLPPPVFQLFGFNHFPVPQTWTGWALAVAAVLVGSLAGEWFKEDHGSRDRILFVAAAGAFLFLAALEYDHKLFEKLAKIGGGGVSVEFSGQANIEPSTNRFTAYAPLRSERGDYVSSSFSGASTVDFAVDWLWYLPQFIVFDNAYALLFANGIVDSDQTTTQTIASMADPTKILLSYACINVAPFAAKAEAIQRFFRSETTALSIDPELVSALRRRYVLLRPELCLSPPSSAGQPSAACKTISNLQNHQDSYDDYKRLFAKARESIDKSVAALGGYKPETLPACEKVPDHLATPSGVNPFSYFSEANGKKEDSYGFFGYFALIVSLAEVGVGARESAVHLLESEIAIERNGLGTFPAQLPCNSSSPDKNCDDVAAPARLSYLQRLVVLLRLEAAQFLILNSLPSEALNLVRARLLSHMIEDYDAALKPYDPE